MKKYNPPVVWTIIAGGKCKNCGAIGYVAGFSLALPQKGFCQSCIDKGDHLKNEKV